MLSFSSSLHKLLKTGVVPTDSPSVAATIIAVNQGSLISFGFSVLTSILFCFFIPYNYYWISIVGTSAYLLTFLYHYMGWRNLARFNIWLVSLPLFFWISSAFGEESYGHLMYLVIILGTISTFREGQYHQMIWVFIVPVILLVVLYLTRFSLFSIPNISIEERKLIGIFNLVGCFLGVGSSLIMFIRENKIKSDKLEASESEIREQFTELQKTHKELDLIVYSVTHDLRAPIVSALALVDISAAETDKEKSIFYHTLQKKSLVRMDKFITDILFYYKNDRTEIKMEEVNCQKIVTDIFLNVENDNPKVEKIYKEKIDAPIIGDSMRIIILLNNLIGNAVRYYNPKAEHSYVKVGLESNEKEVILTVEDNGQGIKEEHQNKVFEMFFRANKNANGSGLGLYIVKETVETLGGKLTMQSVFGKGTTFQITLPNAKIIPSEKNTSNPIDNTENTEVLENVH